MEENNSEFKPRKRIGEILIDHGVIDEHSLKEALDEQKVTRQRLGEILVSKSFASSEQINRALASQSENEIINISDYVILPDTISLVKEEDARNFRAMPLFKSEDTLYVAIKNINDVMSIDQLQIQTGLKIKPLLANDQDILAAIDQYYATSVSVENILASIDEEKLGKGDKDQEAATVKLVNLLIIRAVYDRASDIHLEPEEKVLNVRYRVDGFLIKKYVFPKFLQSAVISRTKIMANLDISEKRLPQDGRIRIKVEGRDIDCRVSTCPTVYGENAVLRILDKTGLVMGLTGLGMPKDDMQKFKEVIAAPYGIILVVGPTGSGKTTTLYSALQILNREDVNLMTVEDPVEYEFPRIRQVNINPKIGLTFANVLRSFLRQDPNIMMVGEIRDLETAEIAVQAALTGHLVLSTLHTNDSPSTFTRLVEMGVEPFLVSSSLLGVLAQRLTRKICTKCKEGYKPSDDVLRALGLEDKTGKEITFYRGKGCSSCGNKGFKGRVGIYEFLRNSRTVQELVLKKASADEIRRSASKEGLKTLRDAAIEKLFEGLITVEEVFRVTQEASIE